MCAVAIVLLAPTLAALPLIRATQKADGNLTILSSSISARLFDSVIDAFSLLPVRW